MKKKWHPFPKAMIPNAVNNHITAAIPCQDPEGEEGEVAPSVANNVAQHKDGNGREWGGKSKSEDADSFGCLNVWTGGSVGAGAFTSLKPLWEKFALAGVAADGSKGQDINNEGAAQKYEVESRK